MINTIMMFVYLFALISTGHSFPSSAYCACGGATRGARARQRLDDDALAGKTTLF